MQMLRRAAAVLFCPLIAFLGAGCDRSAPAAPHSAAPHSAVGPQAELIGTQTDVPDWVGKLLLANTDLLALSDPPSSQEELPGLGHKFELLFAMVDDHDP